MRFSSSLSTGPALVTLEAIEPKGIPGCCVDPFRVKLLTALYTILTRLQGKPLL